MLIKIRNFSNSNKETQIKISKTSNIAKLKGKIEKILAIKPDLQKLYFGGKHLESENTLYDYKINASDVIQLMVMSDGSILKDSTLAIFDVTKSKIESIRDEESKHENLQDAESDFYAIEDPIDCLDSKYGAWFEATIRRICIAENKLTYLVEWDLVENAQTFYANEESIRPRANKVIANENLKIGEKVMINHNLNYPTSIGFWYDFEIEKIFSTNDEFTLTGTLNIGKNNKSLYNHQVVLKEQVYAIEKPKPLKYRYPNDKIYQSNIRRPIAPECLNCYDKFEINCTECGCVVCGGKKDPHLILLCDECEDEYHVNCLKPPLLEIPEDDWYCPKCKNDENEIIKMGQLVKKRPLKNFEDAHSTTKKSKASVKKNVSIVPKNHRGAIPGIEVGSCWSSRLQLFNAGVHSQLISGIHGHKNDCAYSLVLSGNYNDIDYGNEFIYTGSGGHGKNGALNKAVSDQMLTRANRALALNCKAKFNDEVGSTATDWRAGIPVRVIRNYKLSKFSQYAPAEGNRYDGLYKVVKYYPEIDQNGFRKWRYLLKRDDPIPPPWTPEGIIRSITLGLTMNRGNESSQTKNQEAYKQIKKRRTEDKSLKEKEEVDCYYLNSDMLELIEADYANSKLWKNCKSYLPCGKKKFLNQVLLSLQCVCCHELVTEPVTTPCAHNICHSCFERSFSAGLKCCPTCRFNLETTSISINKKLKKILNLLFPKYTRGKE